MNRIEFACGRITRAAIFLTSLILLLPLAANANNKQIDLDLDVQRLARPGPGDRGPVVIGNITDGRSLNPAGTSSVTNQATLVGQHVKNADTVYDVVLVGGKDVTDITRDIIAISLTKMGYVVVAGNDAAGTAPSLDVVVDDFWVENNPNSGNNKKSFDCSFAFTIASSSAPFNNMGTVRGSGFRNGSRATSPKSYSNSLQHSLKFVIQDFETRYNSAARNYAKSEYSLDDSAVDKILEARKLRDEGAISEEEYQQMKDKILKE